MPVQASRKRPPPRPPIFWGTVSTVGDPQKALGEGSWGRAMKTNSRHAMPHRTPPSHTFHCERNLRFTQPHGISRISGKRNHQGHCIVATISVFLRLSLRRSHSHMALPSQATKTEHSAQPAVPGHRGLSTSHP